jgi:hypothetical protein
LIPSELQTLTKNPIQGIVVLFLQLITGYGMKACGWILLCKFDVWPVQSQRAKLNVRLWNRKCELMQRGRDYIGIVTLAADLELFKTGNNVCWTFHF